MYTLVRPCKINFGPQKAPWYFFYFCVNIQEKNVYHSRTLPDEILTSECTRGQHFSVLFYFFIFFVNKKYIYINVRRTLQDKFRFSECTSGHHFSGFSFLKTLREYININLYNLERPCKTNLGPQNAPEASNLVVLFYNYFSIA